MQTNIDLITKYFANLSDTQKQQLTLLPQLYEEWNSKINIISRKDINNIVPNHLLHSLAIAKFISFKEETRVFDIGTGGGLPGIPLAILFPQVNFTLIDSIGKKVRVAQAIAEEVGLDNIKAIQIRAEEYKSKADFIVSRAAMQTKDLMNIASKLIDKKSNKNALPNGLIALKGGDLSKEILPYKSIAQTEEIIDYFQEPFFETKKILYIPL